MVSRQYTMLVVVGVVLSLCLSLSLMNSPLNSFEEVNSHPTIMRTLDSPITITNNTGLASYPGNGTKSDPYRIENLTIDGASGAHCILIAHTTAYFIIKNCTVFNATSGIALNNITEGLPQINNSIAHDTTYGIDLTTVLNATLANNNAYGNLIGISMVGVNHTLIFNNSASSNIYLNFGDGIELNHCWFNEIIKNIFNDNKQKGIYLIESHYNTICGNTILGNAIPWVEDSCTNNIFDKNIADWPLIWGFNLILLLLSLISLSIFISIRKKHL